MEDVQFDKPMYFCLEVLEATNFNPDPTKSCGVTGHKCKAPEETNAYTMSVDSL